MNNQEAWSKNFVECTGRPPEVRFVLGEFDESTFSQIVDTFPKPRALWVMRTEHLEELFRSPSLKGKFITSTQHGAKTLSDYFLRRSGRSRGNPRQGNKKKPIALFGKYEQGKRLQSAVQEFLEQAAKVNDENLYVLGIPAKKESRDVEGFDEFVKLVEKSPRLAPRVPSVEAPEDLYEKFWGNSQEAQKVREDIIKAARVTEFRDTPVLILGSTGAGKDIVAEEIHHYGRGQSGGKLHILNCGAVPRELFETVLFGHEKGAFTGADRSRIGLWELASVEQGTLFLDEIGDLAPDHQVKLLRPLEENKIRRVGGLQEIDVNARVLAATNRDLIRMLGEGTFRQDLYTRLAQIVIRVPTLVADPDQVGLIARRYWREVTEKEEAFLSADVIRLLTRYAWPGGVREIKNFLQGLYFEVYGSIEGVSLEKVKEYFQYRDPRSETSPEVTIEPALQSTGKKRKGRAPRLPGVPTRSWVETQVKQYRAELPRYEILSQVLQQILGMMAINHAPLAVVQSRVRPAAAFAEKIQRIGVMEGSGINLTDSCGARVIVQTTGEVQEVASFVERYFEVNPEGTCRPGQPPPPGTFSFRPITYIVRLDRARSENLASTLGVQIPDSVLGLWAEIQIRTVLEQAWANMGRESLGRGPRPIARKWESELIALGELLKAVDQSFARIRKGVQLSTKDLSSYAARADLLREIDILETVLACDPGNVQVAARAGKVAMALGDWDRAIRLMESHEKSRFQPLLRDLGVALCQKYKKQTGSREYSRGQTLLQAACAAPGNDLDAFASLAGSWKRRGDLEKARELYLRAHVIDPADSYALGCYLEIEITLNPNIVTTMKPSIELTLERCRDLASAGVNLPWAFFDLGKFYLLLGRRAESFSAYSRAIHLSTSSHMIQTSLESLHLIRVGVPETAHLDEARELLALGLAAKFPSEADIDVLLGEWPAKEKLVRPVIIVTGDTAEMDETVWRLPMVEAFRDLGGTLIPLGCSERLGKIVRDIGATSASALRVIAYEKPEMIRAKAGTDEKHEAPGMAGTAGSGLQVWTDLIKSRISPDDVLVLAVGSGGIWSQHIFVALSLGAPVFVVQSPGAPDVALPSNEWAGVTDIKVIALEADALRAALTDTIATKRKRKAHS